MARARNIKPGFFTNDVLAECEPLARILFAGLWTIADRAGRLEERQKKIKAEILAYDECDIDALLEQLAKRDFIRRYTANGKSFIQIVEFSKHQNPHMKEAASTIPAPDEHHTSPVQDATKTGTSPADSLNPITDSLNPHTDSAGPTACGRMARVLREKGVNVTPSHPLLVAWVQKGVTPELALEAVQLARVNKPPPEAIPPKYLDAVIAGLLVPAGSKTAAVQARPWFIQSASAIEAKGRELGLDPDAMPFPHFRSMVLKKAGITEAQVLAAEREYR